MYVYTLSVIIVYVYLSFPPQTEDKPEGNTPLIGTTGFKSWEKNENESEELYMKCEGQKGMKWEVLKQKKGNVELW